MKLILAFCLISLSLACAPQAQECDEWVVIDSVEHKVSERWCGKKLDSTEVADPTSLVRIPDEFCFEESRIYVSHDTRDAFVAMAEAARRDSIDLIADSGFRSAGFQERIIRRRMAEGEKFERLIQFVAPPGYSEHETGRALDLVPSEARFVHTPAYEWLNVHAAEYGFVESLPEDTTGLAAWESWHWYYMPDLNETTLSPATD